MKHVPISPVRGFRGEGVDALSSLGGTPKAATRPGTKQTRLGTLVGTSSRKDTQRDATERKEELAARPVAEGGCSDPQPPANGRLEFLIPRPLVRVQPGSLAERNACLGWRPEPRDGSPWFQSTLHLAQSPLDER